MASINSIFGRTKSDGTFDLRMSENKGRSETIGGRIATKVIAGAIVNGSVIADKAIDKTQEELLKTFGPAIADAVNDYYDFNQKFYPLKRVNELIKQIPSNLDENKRFELVKDKIDSEFFESQSDSTIQFLESIIENKIILKIELLIEELNNCYWLNFAELAILSDDLKWAKVSPLFKIRNIKANYRLNKSIISYYNNRSNQKYEELKTLIYNSSPDFRTQSSLIKQGTYDLLFKKIDMARWMILYRFHPKIFRVLFMEAKIKLAQTRQKLGKR